MKDLRILSEISTRYGNRNINELEFKTPEEFATYKKKHKMRPGTVVKVAGKDKVVGGDDASKASPKKRFSDIPFTQADVGQIKQFAKDNNLDIKDMSRDPNGNLSVDFDGSPEDMEKALTSDAYGDDPQDAKDTVARGTEIGKDDESKPKETTPIENRPGEQFGKNFKSVGDMMDSISQQKERVQLNITDFDSMDQFNGALFIEDGKLKYPGIDGEPTEVNDQDTQMAVFDLVQDGEVNVGRSEFRQGDKIKDNGGMHAANILKNLKGNWDFDGVQKIGNDFYNADGEKMDNDEIDDFYYEQGYDENDDNVGVELGKPLPSDAKPASDETDTDSDTPSVKAQFDDAVDFDPSSVGDMIDRNIQSIPEEERGTTEEAIYALQDAEQGMISDEDADWAKKYLKDTIAQYIKESKNSDLRELSKITTRYNK